MKNFLALPVLMLLIFSVLTKSNAQSQDTFYRLANIYFKKYVKDGLVNYRYAKSNSKEINVIYNLIGKYDLSEASIAEKKAFYTNTYNILIIYQIINLYPISNPLDEKGFFNENEFNVAGEMLTLDQLEKGKMLKELKEPRFHFVLACAAMSCPPLPNYAYTPANIEAELTKKTRELLNSPSFVSVNSSQKKVMLSKIFDWYRSDFGDSLVNYINQYRTTKIPSDYNIDFFEYNWQLNERKG
ncbi:MAG: DUF547 domain-containing protein [Bacteroidota bacterium]